MSDFTDSIWIDPATSIGYSRQLDDSYQQYFHRYAVDELLRQLDGMEAENERLKDRHNEMQVALTKRIAFLETALRKVGSNRYDPIIILDILSSALSKEEV